MIQFNELRITPEGNQLIVDVAVIDNAYYANVTIDDIVIDTQNTYIDNGPSSTPIFSFKDADKESLIYSNDGDKHIRLTLNENVLERLNNNIFFVYIIAKGEPTIEMDYDSVIMGTALNLYPIYQESIKYINELNCECNIPKNFIDLILNYKALELYIRTGNYSRAIKHWNKYFYNK